MHSSLFGYDVGMPRSLRTRHIQSHNSSRMAVVYVLMYFKRQICFTVYTGETKTNDIALQS